MTQPTTMRALGHFTTMYGPAHRVKDYGLDRRCNVCNGKLSRYNPLPVCTLHTAAMPPPADETERRCASCYVTRPIQEFLGPKNQSCKSCRKCREKNRKAKAEAAANGYKRPRDRRRAADRPQTAPAAPAARSQGSTQPRPLPARETATEGF